MKRFLLSGLVVVTCLATIVVAQSNYGSRQMRFVYDDPDGRNVIMFTSEAPLQTIVGHSGALYGSVDVNLDTLSGDPQVSFECDLRTLKTGVSTVDDQMLSSAYLNADMYPMASFRLLKIRKANPEVLANEGVADLAGRGIFTLRGIEDTVNVNIKATYFQANEVTSRRLPGDILRIKADFEIRMSKYGIVIPETAFLMVDDRVRIEIDAYGGSSVAPLGRP